MAILTVQDVDAVSFPTPGRKEPAYAASSVDRFRADVRESLDVAARTKSDLASANIDLANQLAESETRFQEASGVTGAVSLLEHAQRVADEHINGAQAQASDTIAAAQVQAEETISAAQTHAEEILERAQVQVAKFLDDKKAEAQRLTEEISELRTEKAEVTAQLESMLARANNRLAGGAGK